MKKIISVIKKIMRAAFICICGYLITVIVLLVLSVDITWAWLFLSLTSGIVIAFIDWKFNLNWDISKLSHSHKSIPFNGGNGINYSSSSSPSYSSPSSWSNSTSNGYTPPQTTPSNFEFERRSSERASRISHLVYNSDLSNSDNQQELERLRRDQNADNHFNS